MPDQITYHGTNNAHHTDLAFDAQSELTMYDHQGNSYDNRVDSKGNTGYHYSNTNGSYYYSNTNGSTYYNSGKGYSQYTSPVGDTTTKIAASSTSNGGSKGASKGGK